MKPTLVVFPWSDEVFSKFAHLLVDHGAFTPVEMQRRLRSAYPAATVHARELSGEPVEIWYVYRDGRWLPDGGRDERATQVRRGERDG